MNKKKRLNKKKVFKPFVKHEVSWYIVGFFVVLLLLVSYLKKLEYFELNPLLIFVPVLLLSIYIIMKSAGFAIEAISHYAENTGISHFVIGFVVVAIATSLPELSTAYFASALGKGGYVIGDVIGANIINLCLVIGIMAIIAGKIKLKKGMIGKTFFEEFGILLLPIILGIDGTFSKIDGTILIIGFILYLLILIKQHGKLGTLKKSIKIKHIWKDIIVFGGTIAAILLSTSLLVQSLNIISKILNIPSIIIGALFLAIATTIPELTVGIKSVLKGMHHISLGNVFGSLIVNFSLVIGIAALIKPITIMKTPLLLLTKGFSAAGSFDYVSFFLGCIIFLFAIYIMSTFIKSLTITKKHGKILISIAVIFFIVQIALAVLRNMM